jgi:hypothetical protein
MGELLAKVSAVTGDWWFLNLWDDRNPFFDTVGGRIWLWKGEEEKFKIVPAPDAPRKPRRGPPATDEIAAQVRSAIERVRGADEHADAAVQALCDLIEDPYVRDAVPAEVREGIQLLCELRPVRAVPDLVDHIALATGGGQDEYPTWIDGLYTQYDFRKVPNGMKMAYDQWLLCFPCVGALAKIGQPSVGPLIEAIGTTDLVVPASYPDPRAQASRLQCKAVLLCETLVRILGADAAIARLREAATAEKDAAKSTRLRDAADRITRGLPPPPP